MPNWISPRQRVEAALRGEVPDMVPLTAYTELFPRCAAERQLREGGLCLVQRSPGVCAVSSPNVLVDEQTVTAEDGTGRIRTTVRTPVGTVTSERTHVPVGPTPLDRVMGWTSWTNEYPFKGPDDYDTLEFVVRDRSYAPDYAGFTAKGELMGEDAIMRAGIGYEPLQEIIYHYMGVDRFAIEWADNRERLLRLHDALVEDRRKIYPIVAQSPALITNYGGNVSPEVVGTQRFERYILPQYEEAAEVFHAHGKLLGVHFDANVRRLAPGIARSSLDYIEAYTPAPGSDFSLAEARAAWPDKVLWIQFPPVLYHSPDAVIEETTRQFLRDTAPGDRFIIGVTDDVPSHRLFPGLQAIQCVLRAGAGPAVG